jgi:hypothetical protein
MTKNLRTFLRDLAEVFWTDEQLDGFLAAYEGESHRVQLWSATRDAIDEMLARDPMPDMSDVLRDKYRHIRVTTHAEAQRLQKQEARRSA